MSAGEWPRAGLVLIVASAIWLALSATVVLLPPATLGLVIVAAWLTHGVVPRPEAVLRGVRRHSRAIFLWGAVIGAALALRYALDYYDPLAGRVSPGLATLLKLALGVWLALQLYALPLLLVQRDGSMLGAWRSALLLALAAPLYTALVLGIGVLIAMLARWLPIPLLVIAPGALALLGNAAVANRLSAYGLPVDPPPS